MKNRLLLLTLSLFISIFSYAQEEFSNPKSFKVGLQAGGSIIGGDVAPNAGIDIGLHAVKSFNKFFAVRSTLVFNQSKGIGYWVNPIETFNNRAVSELGYASFVNNYSTRFFDLSVEPMFKATQSKTTLYAGIGPSLHLYYVRYDAFNANGTMYDYSALTEAIDIRGDFDRSDRAIVRDILDGTYETKQATDKAFEENLAMGLSFRVATFYAVSPRLSIGMDSRLLFSTQDNLDGFRTIDDPFLQNDQVLSFSVIGNYTL